MMAKPLTADEAKAVMARTIEDAEANGLWLKQCARCDRNIGGRLASLGKPTPQELQRCACPRCGAVGEVKLEYQPGRT